jgi:hypothetical protein
MSSVTNIENGQADFDITGGYDPGSECFLPTRPDNPEMRDSASMWISDSKGRFGLPRFSVEAVAKTWEDRGVQANIAFPDGRVLIGAGGFAPSPAKVVEGGAATLNAGPLTFEVIEPLRRWTMRFDGEAYETTVHAQMRGGPSGPKRRVWIAVDARMCAPPWSPGERSTDNATIKAVGAVGGHRHEQLFRCEGVFEIVGEAAIEFDGTGLFVRRFGARDTTAFPGHIWMSALFPSGKAFGVLAFPPRDDGTPAYSEAILFDGRRKTYARLVEGPWMTNFEPHGGPVDLVLETDDGERVRIGGVTHDSTFIAKGDPMFGDWAGTPPMRRPFHQGGARYQWDGETAHGMIERSLPAEKVRF